MSALAHRIVTLVIKELLSYLRDPRTRLILIGPPLLQLLIFSFAATLEVRNVDLAIMNRDSGQAASRLIERIAAASFVDKVHMVQSPERLRSMIDDKAVLLVLTIPSDFSERLLAGEQASLQLILDGRRANAAQIAIGYLNSLVRGYDFVQDSAKSLGTIAIRHWYNPNLNYQWFIVPSLSGMLALIMSMMVSALSIARERELGTFDQILVSPLSATEIIIGKSLPALLIGFVLGLLMALAGVFLFRIPFTGSVTMLILSLPLCILSGVGIGLSVSAMSHTQQQAILGAFTVIIPIVLTSGYATPVENMPEWLQSAAMANPLRWYLLIVQGSFLKSLSLVDVLANVWPMLLIAAVTLSLAVLLVRSRLA